MDLRQLRYFLAITEEGSFSRAAARLGVAQPALSLHVRKMEEALGTPLLLRGPQGVATTEAGELLARRARALLEDFDQTEEEVRSLGQEPSGTVRLGLPGTISGILSVPLIARCRARYPQIKIVIAEAMSGFVAEWLLEGRIEIAVLYSDLREPGLRAEALLEEELVMLLPPGDEAAEGEVPVTFDSLAERPLILPSRAHGLRKMLETQLRRQSVALDTAIEVDSYASIKQLVESGYGCSVLPYHSVAEEGRDGRLTLRRFAEPRLWRGAYLAQGTSRRMTRAAGAVSDLLKEVVEDLIAERIWAGARRPVATPGGC